MGLLEKNFDLTEKIGKGALLSVVDSDGRKSTMTVSWGGSGILWGKEVCFLFVRPQRYTYNFTEAKTVFSLSFFDDSFKDVLSYCGTKSGRDVDKFKECGLEYTLNDGACVFGGATCTLILKKLYGGMLCEDGFLSERELAFYKEKDYHKMYVCEITKVI